jgi:hypothetical protein
MAGLASAPVTNPAPELKGFSTQRLCSFALAIGVKYARSGQESRRVEELRGAPAYSPAGLSNQQMVSPERSFG